MATSSTGTATLVSCITEDELEEIAAKKTQLLQEFFAAEPPKQNGEDLLDLWNQIYDDNVYNTVVDTLTGDSDDDTNPVFPYEKLQAIVLDGGNWKWQRMWQKLDELERRGPAYRKGEKLHFDQPNKNPHIVPLNVLVVGAGPVGLRLAIELVLGGHKVSIFEKRREKRSAHTKLEVLGFTNRINRPHMWPFVRNDLAKLNGKDFMSAAACYPVFTEPVTSSIGIDELQMLLLKNALLLGVDILPGTTFVDAKVVFSSTSSAAMTPQWNVEFIADEAIAEQFGLEKGKNAMTFDCLVGCDGPRSPVRTTQAKYFGEVDRRKFMDAVGIVINIRKVSRGRLKELGFQDGFAPKDMNRSCMLFRDFFDKILKEADADIDNLIYYKAGFHYYVIITPKRANLIKHGLSGKLYHIETARTTPEAAEDKAKLKQYVAKVLKAAGIPIDDQLENDGFVDAPNDVMAFDFAEIWSTKKAMSFSLPPADVTTKEHGEKLHPFVGLAGDALFEAFWPEGLGLKRGWQAVMDTCYCIDNLHNRALFAKTMGKVEWTDHWAALQKQNATNFEMLHRLNISADLGRGEYDDKGLVMTQLNKEFRDAEKPPFELEIDPWTRYGPLSAEREKMHGERAREVPPVLHPVVRKAIAKREFYRISSVGGTGGEIKYVGRNLVAMNGREFDVDGEEDIEDTKSEDFKPPPRGSLSSVGSG